jgi:predicted dehydrogenase
MDILRVGLVGCGSIAERELDGLSQVRGARVVATADPMEERALLLAGRAGGARAYTDYRRLLEDDEVDAVIISTPNFLHAQQTICAAQAGKHVLVQKPLALTLHDIDSMDRATKHAGITAMALMMTRFQSCYLQLKDMLDNETLGVPLVYRTHYSHSGIGKAHRMQRVERLWDQRQCLDFAWERRAPRRACIRRVDIRHGPARHGRHPCAGD